MAQIRSFTVFVLVAICGLGCAAKAPELPYTVFARSNDIPDSFLAGLPETRSKILSSNPTSRRTSLLLQIPAEWSFGTGAALDKTLELYLLRGDLTLGEFELTPGGYAYLPSGSLGVKMSSNTGAFLLYFLDEPKPKAVIQTPIIADSDLLPWTERDDGVANFGIATKELRNDPGSGAQTWIMKIEPGAIQDWQSATTVQEGFLISGQYRHAECIGGESIVGDYTDGGYFLRPPGAVNGGPEAAALSSTIWFMRVPSHSDSDAAESCVP